MATPVGLSGEAAIELVAAYANEPNLPTPAQVLIFLQRGLEEVERRLNGIFLWKPYPTVNLQTFIELDADVQYIVSANFSSGATNTSGFITNSSPLSQGSLVYPMMQLEQATFMDAAAGFPATGFGPPQAFFIYQDQGYDPTTTLDPPAAPVYALTTGASTIASVSSVLTYVNAAGETPPSAVSTQALDVGANAAAVLSPQGISNALGYNVYALTSGIYYLQNASPIALGTPYTIANTPTTTGAQPPSANTATGSGQGGAIFMQLYPSAMIGQVNVYYKARPQLWADTTATSWTNLDSSLQEAVVLYAVIRTLQSRGRAGEAKSIWVPDYEAMIESMRETISARTRPKSGRVRDVATRSYPNFPTFMTG